MNWMFFLLIALGYTTTVWHQIRFQNLEAASPMQLLTQQLLQSASDAVTLAIGLIGVLGLFLGLMKILEEANILNNLSKLIYPLLKKLFPDIPPYHPAFGAMMMNLTANMLGMGNVATPFGLKAMQELNKLNPHPGIATNAMVLFLALNTASITLLPTKVIALRVSAGSTDATSIIAPTLIATCFAIIIAVLTAKLLQPFTKVKEKVITPHPQTEFLMIGYPVWASYLFLASIILLIPLMLLWGKIISAWLIPTLIVSILGYGLYRKLDIYRSFTEGAKAGFDLAISIMPFLIAILVAMGMLRTSGALDSVVAFLGPFVSQLGLPVDVLPLVLMRPLSGSGSLGILSDILNNPSLGPDSYAGILASTIMGSTETTFYVLAVYFGAVQIRRIRHALVTGLIAELAGLIASVIAVSYLF